MPCWVGAPLPTIRVLDVDILAGFTYPAHPSAASWKGISGWVEPDFITVDQGERLCRVDPLDREGFVRPCAANIPEDDRLVELLLHCSIPLIFCKVRDFMLPG